MCDLIQFCLKRSFHHHKVYEISPASETQLELLQEFENNTEIDFWTRRSSINDPVEVMVPPSHQTLFENILDENNVDFKIIIPNVEEIIARERFRQTSAPDIFKGAISFEKYLRYFEIQDYLNYLAVEYPDIVALENCGLSYENRNLTLIRISTSGSSRMKPAIFIDAGIHAREWIAPAQALYIIHQLLENPENSNLIENVDWMVIPLLNPDGYEYTHTEDRFWRKTRSVQKGSYGVDPNRNFDFHWMERGSSNDQYSQIYAGPMPFSEPETFSLRQIIEKNVDQIQLYLTIHSAAKCILYPWGYTAKLPEDAFVLHDLAVKVEKTISAVNGNRYRIGSSSTVLSYSAGSSRDWVKGVAGIQLSYTLELPGGGEKGFDLPADQILVVVKEIFAGIKVFHQYIEEGDILNKSLWDA